MVTKKLFGTLADGREIDIYEIKNINGVSASVITYGATWQSLFAPDRNGNFKDILIGFDDIEGHVERTDYQGMIVGRYANRICDGRFTVDGKEYSVTKNEKGITCLHGGGEFSHAVWTAEIKGDNALSLAYTSPEGSNGFPGVMTAEVIYTLSDDNELSIDYKASCTEASPINLTNHAYFNLGGFDRKDVLSQELFIRASRYTPIDTDSIPTGELRDVTGTAFDFREMKAIGRDILDNDEQLVNCRNGYDHNFCLDNIAGEASAAVYDPESGRYMEMFTDLPGVQLYTGNFLEDVPGKGDTKMGKHAGFCLETQYYPDSPNRPEFPNCVYAAGEEFKSRTSFKFSVKG
ncbi:MAG: galactose mutarotase [Clostridia bacterium]|nr:galactose mutarotase [Clostridia bacterium]